MASATIKVKDRHKVPKKINVLTEYITLDSDVNVSSAYLCKSALKQGCSIGCQDITCICYCIFWQLLARFYAVVRDCKHIAIWLLGCSGYLLMYWVGFYCYAVASMFRAVARWLPHQIFTYKPKYYEYYNGWIIV